MYSLRLELISQCFASKVSFGEGSCDQDRQTGALRYVLAITMESISSRLKIPYNVPTYVKGPAIPRKCLLEDVGG